MQCKNCGHKLHGAFCASCGQKSNVGRITFMYLWNEGIHFFAHIDKGFVFTSLRMLSSPGRTVQEFIEGKRKSYQSPVSYFLIWTTVYILFLFWVERIFGENVVINYKEYFGPSATTRVAIGHLALVLAIIIPFQALYLYLLVTKSFYNYFETMTATIYSLGTVILVQFVFAIGALLIHVISGISVDLRVSDVLKVLYLAWFIINVLAVFRLNRKFLRAAAFMILAFGTFTIWRLFGFARMMEIFSR